VNSRPAAASTSREPIFTADFTLASLSSFAAFSSFYLLLATLPVYVSKIGGGERAVGMIIGVFSTTAVLLRLPLGRACDERGKRGFMLAGALLMTLCGGFYFLSRSVPVLMGVRVAHGIGWALFGTTISALVADLVPARRRGEAMGYYGVFSNLAMAIGPAAGVFLMRGQGFGLLFAASAAMSLLAFATTVPIREQPPASRPSQTGPRQSMIERSSLFPSLVLGLMAMGYGVIVSFLPLYAAKLGIANPGVFFTAYAITLVLARPAAGKLSDRFGRATVIVPGLALVALALAALAFARTQSGLVAIAILFGLGFAAVYPALMALVVDRAPPGRRGAAMGTFATAMDLGIGGGSFLWGFVAEWTGFAPMFVSAGAVSLVALALFLALNRAPSAVTAEPLPRK